MTIKKDKSRGIALDPLEVANGAIKAVSNFNRLTAYPYLDDKILAQTGKTRADLVLIIEEMFDLPGSVFLTMGSSFLGYDALELTKLIRTPQLEIIRRYTESQVNRILASADLADAIEANKSTDKSVLYENLPKFGFKEAKLVPGQKIYIGIRNLKDEEDDFEKGDTLADILTPAEYFDSISTKVRDGVAARATTENLPGLESIYCYTNINNAPGLAALSFEYNPEEMKLWAREKTILGRPPMHLFTPSLFQRPFDLIFKNIEYVNRKGRTDIFKGMTESTYNKYTSEVSAKVRDAKISYQIVNPKQKIIDAKIFSKPQLIAVPASVPSAPKSGIGLAKCPVVEGEASHVKVPNPFKLIIGGAGGKR